MLARLPVLKRLYPSLCKVWAKLFWPGGYKILSYHGLKLIVNYRNYIDRQIAFFGGHETAQVAHLLSLMRQGCDMFIDVGANFGLYSLQVAQSGLARAVHAFEPDDRNAAQLGGNLYLNRLAEKISIHREAVSNNSGELRFNIYPDTSTGQTRVAEDGNVTLAAVTLDETFPLSGKKIFIKIDIEGHELSALEGAKALLQNNNCVLQIESFPRNADALASFLAPFGYAEAHRIDDDYFFMKSA